MEKNFKLKTLIIHNFKLFSHAVINMDSANLVLLDGPNGYGKTSTFDALEYLFTGNVKRVAANIVNKSNTSFSEDCLIKTPSDGSTTYVEGHLENSDGQLFSIKRILSKGKNSENNPSKIQSRTTTEVIFDNETICKNESNVYIVNQIIEKYLGDSLVKNYNEFYYIAQEDRLKFLSKSDSQRLQEIQKLFGIETEEEILNKVNRAKLQFNVLSKNYKNQLDQKKSLIEQLEEQVKGKNDKQQVAYRKIFVNEEVSPVWDREHPLIECQEKLLETINQIESVRKFSQDIDFFKQDNTNLWVEEKIAGKEDLKKMLYIHSYRENIEILWEKLEKYNKIIELLEAAELDNGSYDYEKYDYIELKELLDIEVNIEEIRQIQGEIDRYRKNIKNEDAARDKMTQLQEQMKKERDYWIQMEYQGIADNQCPLCGHKWSDKKELIIVLQSFKQVIDNGKGDSQKLLDSEIAQLKRIYLEHYEEKVTKYLEDNKFLSQVICEEIFKSWKKIKLDYHSFINDCAKFGVQINHVITNGQLKDSEQIVENFIKKDLSKIKTNILDDYYLRKQQYQYDNIFSVVYKSNIDKVYKIEDKEFKSKITYVEQEYYSGKNIVIEAEKKKLKKIQERYTKSNKIELDLVDMKGKIEQELKKYKAKMVKQLQAPFFIYTGRILQNYPGGLGIKLDLVNNEKIRFEAANRKEHDVLYTLSSGQLSAIAIALALTLNKVYTHDSVKYAFIDDPIQTMDELNVSSFVEVLRNDFPDYQFILSTHEDNFSDYIRYKYRKYLISNKSIDVRMVDINV